MQVHWTEPAQVVAGAFVVSVGLYLLVVLAFRLAERRTVAELAPFDLAAIIAIGATVGGTATGRNSVAVGVAAVAGLLLAHAGVARLRRQPSVRAVIDQSPVVLVRHGLVQPAGLRRAGLTPDDLDAALRARGVRRLPDVELAVFETRSGVSVLVGPEPAPLWQSLDRYGRGPPRGPPSPHRRQLAVLRSPSGPAAASGVPPHRAADRRPRSTPRTTAPPRSACGTSASRTRVFILYPPSAGPGCRVLVGEAWLGVWRSHSQRLRRSSRYSRPDRPMMMVLLVTKPQCWENPG